MTSFTEHIVSFFPLLSSSRFLFTTTLHNPPSSKAILFFSTGPSVLPFLCFLLFLPSCLFTQMSPFCPGDETTVVKSDWGEVIFGLWRERKGERRRHQTAGWWLHGLFYISKLADSEFSGHFELTILVILVYLKKISNSFEASLPIIMNTHRGDTALSHSAVMQENKTGDQTVTFSQS